MNYKWTTSNRRPQKTRVHIVDENGKTLCQSENGSDRMAAAPIHSEPDPARPMCALCEVFAGLREPFTGALKAAMADRGSVDGNG